MTTPALELWLTIFGTGCWGVCFYWMHTISRRQDKMLDDLHRQARRIEEFSRAEHELIKEVHPNVTEIKERVAEVADAVDAVAIAAVKGAAAPVSGAL